MNNTNTALADLQECLAESAVIASNINSQLHSNYTAYQAYAAFDCAYTINGMADRLVAKHGEYLRYNRELREWNIYYCKGRDTVATWHRITNIEVIISQAVDALRGEMQLLTSAATLDLFPSMPVDQPKNLFRFYFAMNTPDSVSAIETALQSALVMTQEDRRRADSKGAYLKQAKTVALMRKGVSANV